VAHLRVAQRTNRCRFLAALTNFRNRCCKIVANTSRRARQVHGIRVYLVEVCACLQAAKAEAALRSRCGDGEVLCVDVG
jgi:hypothetical protein